jgi:hypothetical protein
VVDWKFSIYRQHRRTAAFMVYLLDILRGHGVRQPDMFVASIKSHTVLIRVES